MTKLSDQAMKDMNRLAVDRVRTAVMSVGQLVDDDTQRAAILASVAMDLIHGAAVIMADESGNSEKHETGLVLLAIVERLGLVDVKRDRAGTP
jgi:hypothetical protein